MNLERQMDQAQTLLTQTRVDKWDILATRSQSLSIRVTNPAVDKFLQADSQGLVLRLLRAGRLGFSYLLGGGPQAVASADPEPFLSLASPALMPPAPQVFDPALESELLEAKVERTRRLARAASRG
ncbi:hypothetical protein DFAR_1140007 [Desulfarculales bacterium]